MKIWEWWCETFLAEANKKYFFLPTDLLYDYGSNYDHGKQSEKKKDNLIDINIKISISKLLVNKSKQTSPRCCLWFAKRSDRQNFLLLYFLKMNSFLLSIDSMGWSLAPAGSSNSQNAFALAFPIATINWKYTVKKQLLVPN